MSIKTLFIGTILTIVILLTGQLAYILLASYIGTASSENTFFNEYKDLLWFCLSAGTYAICFILGGFFTSILTDQRKIIAKVMSESNDHPDVDELYKRVSKIDSKISIATVYRTVKLFEEVGILTKHEFRGGKARYEEINEGHHDHLIDIKSGEIIEFVDDEIEKLQKKVAEKHGYTLVDHKLELYGIKKKS